MTDQHGQRGARMTRWARKSVYVVSWIGVLSMTLPGCASGPPAPDWQVNARGALERAVAAYFDGNSRVEGAEFARARAEVGRTGQAALVARAELVRCASRVASLVVEACDAFEALRQDAPAPERAYADYLAGRFLGPTSETGPGGHRPGPAAAAAPRRGHRQCRRGGGCPGGHGRPAGAHGRGGCDVANRARQPGRAGPGGGHRFGAGLAAPAAGLAARAGPPGRAGRCHGRGRAPAQTYRVGRWPGLVARRPRATSAVAPRPRARADPRGAPALRFPIPARRRHRIGVTRKTPGTPYNPRPGSAPRAAPADPYP